jgi:hypothetical protein
MLAVGALPIVAACGMAIYFAGYKPEKLQSEDYQIRQAALELIREKGGRLPVEPSSIDSIANPLAPRRR